MLTLFLFEMSVSTKDIRICFVGESFVNGTGDRTHLGWTGRLCQSLSHQRYEVTHYNLGIRRETSSELRLRWEKEYDRRFSPQADNRIVFSFGTNDTTWENGKTRVNSADSIENTRQILSDAKTKCPVLMISPPPIEDAEQNDRIQTLSIHFSQLCAELEIPYFDIFTPLFQSSIWLEEVKAGDGAHPGANGYTEYAQLVENWPAWKNWFTA